MRPPSPTIPDTTGITLDTPSPQEAAPATPATATRSRPWGYPANAGKRDLRIDVLRGLAIVFVVVDHIALPSLYYLVSHARNGAVSGAKFLVLLSGLVLGLVYRRRAIEDGWKAVARRVWSRARLLYVTALLIVLTASLISLLPGIDADAIATKTDEATGTTCSMYGSTPLLADCPTPPGAVLDVVFLNVGPFQFNVMGLYVVLIALAPLALRLLLADRWRLLLGVSWGLYALNAVLHARLPRPQFEDSFPRSFSSSIRWPPAIAGALSPPGSGVQWAV